MMVTALVRWSAYVTAPALPWYRDCSWEINGSADRQYSAFVFEITQLTITTITHNRRGPSRVPVQTNIQFTWQITQGRHCCLQPERAVWGGGDVAATVILQQRKKKAANVRPKNCVNSVMLPGADKVSTT